MNPLSRRDLMARLAWGGAGALLLPAPAGAAALPGDADLRLTLAGAAAANRGRSGAGRSDLVLDLSRRGGAWDPEAWAFADGFNTADHSGPAQISERAGGLDMDVRLTLGDDPWVPGGAARFSLAVTLEDGRAEGTYTGEFDGRPVAGRVWGVLPRDPWPLPPPPGFAPAAPGEHPRLVFRKADRDRLLKRAGTDWGRGLLARLRETLAEPFVYVGDYGADSAYFAAGHAFLFWLTGDAAALAASREIAARSMTTVPMRKGHQYAYSHHLMGLALAYDLCYDAWDDALRRDAARYLEDTSALVIAGRGPAFNHSPGSNWVARSRGAAGMALTAIDGDPGVADPERARRLRRIAERSVARYLVYGAGERGFGAEGDGYHVESMEMVLGMMQAYRTAYGREMAAGAAGAPARWTLPLFLLRSFAGGEDGNEPRVHRYGRHGEESGAVPATLLCLGLGSVAPAHRPAVRHFFERHWAAGRGDGSFGVRSPHAAPYVLALYPDGVRPRPIEDVLPRAVRDERQGFCVFRAPEFVTTVYAKAAPPHGWNFPEAGTFRIRGLGTDWAVRAGVGPRDAENVALVRRLGAGPEPPSGNGTGRVTHFRARPDGSGEVGMDLDGVYRAEKGAAAAAAAPPVRASRFLLVDYGGACGAPALFVLADRLTGGAGHEWLLHTGARGARLDGPSSFVLEGEDGATLRATFVAPSPPLRLSVEERPEGGPRTVRAARADPDAPATEFLVVMTVQRRGAPAPAVALRGDGAELTVGRRTIPLRDLWHPGA